MITPERAHELLAGTVPGPWLCEGDGAMHLIGTEDFGLIVEADNENDGRLIAAAPDLAETIAKMTWEYAVQVEIRPGVWRYLSHGETVTQLSHKAKWFTTPGDACRYAKDRGWPEHTVRRLVSTPEVIS